MSGFTDQALVGLLAYDEVGALLVGTDLTKGHGTGPVPVGPLDASRGWDGLACCLCAKLLAWGFAAGRFASSLLGTSHVAGMWFVRGQGIYLLYRVPCYLVGLASLGRPIATKGEIYVCNGAIYTWFGTLAKMTVRRKGGKGLGRGGVKHHRQMQLDNIQGITKPAIRPSGLPWWSQAYLRSHLRKDPCVLKVFLENVICEAITYTEHTKRKTVNAMDVVLALKRQGLSLYGFGGYLPCSPSRIYPLPVNRNYLRSTNLYKNREF